MTECQEASAADHCVWGSGKSFAIARVTKLTLKCRLTKSGVTKLGKMHNGRPHKCPHCKAYKLTSKLTASCDSFWQNLIKNATIQPSCQAKPLCVVLQCNTVQLLLCTVLLFQWSAFPAWHVKFTCFGIIVCHLKQCCQSKLTWVYSKFEHTNTCMCAYNKQGARALQLQLLEKVC